MGEWACAKATGSPEGGRNAGDDDGRDCGRRAGDGRHRPGRRLAAVAGPRPQLHVPRARPAAGVDAGRPSAGLEGGRARRRRQRPLRRRRAHPRHGQSRIGRGRLGTVRVRRPLAVGDAPRAGVRAVGLPARQGGAGGDSDGRRRAAVRDGPRGERRLPQGPGRRPRLAAQPARRLLCPAAHVELPRVATRGRRPGRRDARSRGRDARGARQAHRQDDLEERGSRRPEGGLLVGDRDRPRRATAVRPVHPEGRRGRRGEGRCLPLALRRARQQLRHQHLDTAAPRRPGLRGLGLRHRRRPGEADSCGRRECPGRRRSTSPTRCRTTTAA